jgi:hypothetical protein
MPQGIVRKRCNSDPAKPDTFFGFLEQVDRGVAERRPVSLPWKRTVAPWKRTVAP